MEFDGHTAESPNGPADGPRADGPRTDVPPPGWHPDPGSAGRLRWWSGTAWTEHTAAPVGASPAAYTPLFGPEPSPREQVANNAKVTRWLSWAVFLTAVVQTATFMGMAIWLRIFIRDFDEFVEASETSNSPFGPGMNSGPLVGVQLLSVFSYVPLILRMVWTHRALSSARALGAPLRRDPGLACAAWIIPIVNLWWPMQSMRDLFPGDHPMRRLIGWWWAGYLVGPLLSVFALGVAVFVDGPAGLSLFSVPFAVMAGSAWLERRLVLGAYRLQQERAGLSA
jgi:Domain of unknown function (DUF4328)/Protein of unknown function (DUF2510)